MQLVGSNEIIIYSVVAIDFSWNDDSPKPSIIATYNKREDAILKKDLCKKIATVDQSKVQYQVVSINVKDKNESQKTT
jgi:hypothetical protein